VTDRGANEERVPDRDEVFRYFLGLGFVNIGGPAAQITMMYQAMVERRHWLSEARFVRIMSVCHVLPGPEALQLAIYVGWLLHRIRGGIAAGVLFVLPGIASLLAKDCFIAHAAASCSSEVTLKSAWA